MNLTTLIVIVTALALFVMAVKRKNKKALYGNVFLRDRTHNTKAKSVDVRLRPYLNDFIQASEMRNEFINLGGLTMVVGEPRNPKHYGETAYENLTVRPMRVRVIISPRSLEMGAGFLRWLIFHELGHAILGLDHINGREHIMNTGSVAGNTQLTLGDRDKIRIDELFYSARRDWGF